MVPQQPTRRDALHLAGLAVVGLAGCATHGSGEQTSGSTPTPTATEREYPSGVDDPATRKVRNLDGEPAIRSSAHTPSRDQTSQGRMESDSHWLHEYWFVMEPAERDALEFTYSSSGVDAAKAFVADTDLSETTLLIQQYVAEACTAVTLDRFEWRATDQGPEGAIDLRAIYDERRERTDCETPTSHASSHENDYDPEKAVRAIVARLPVNAEYVSGFQYGW